MTSLLVTTLGKPVAPVEPFSQSCRRCRNGQRKILLRNIALFLLAVALLLVVVHKYVIVIPLFPVISVHEECEPPNGTCPTPSHPCAPMWDGVGWPDPHNVSTPEQRLMASLGELYHSSVCPRDRMMLADLLQVFDAATRRLNITYFMCHGTLLGSWRHHGMVPWDDEVDVCIDARHVEKGILQRIIDVIPDNYHIIVGIDGRMKFYRQDGRRVQTLISNFNYPFVDVSYFHVNERDEVFLDTPWRKTSWNSHELVFPLTTRPFWNLQLPAPRDSEAVLRDLYGDITVCKTHVWSHKAEAYKIWTEVQTLSCDVLTPFLPIVRRVTEANRTIEQLQLGENTVSRHVVYKDRL